MEGEESKISQTSNELRENKDVRQTFVIILKETGEIPNSGEEEREGEATKRWRTCED